MVMTEEINISSEHLLHQRIEFVVVHQRIEFVVAHQRIELVVGSHLASWTSHMVYIQSGCLHLT